ncbi:WecB/TagA/CpsF family glycosyltransferase [Salipiger mucosus]|uniref:Glycosyl transferase, WecB/TagA/CpsF family n=1 Tax=Salipiger mucosus DSM 16094 TaxID=1123237 RepID=S9RWA8_9RHOB|nr:WecB/TagA/CpsF family glycosyltransferase [Salipiger mucosus]EPX82315.1 Glycosyl transferase, WecB/TagA/CpsF family [Salipiger mucosus DSM 16094]
MEFNIGGARIAVNVPTWAALRARVAERLAQQQGFALATINLDHLVKLRASQRFRVAYAAQDFVTADGHPIMWMSWLAKRPVELIPGSDAILPLSRIAARQGVPVALVGATEVTLQRARTYLEREVRDLEVVCTISPPMGFDPDSPEAADILRQVGASGAGLCFVALGAPKQEIFAAAGRRHAPAVGFVSIGAGLDFLAGVQPRAPEWARRFAMEWLWRAISDPGRLGRRYLSCVAILPGQVLRAMVLRFRSRRI